MHAHQQQREIAELRARLDAWLAARPEADAARYVAGLMLTIGAGLRAGLPRETIEARLADGPAAAALDRIAAERALLERTAAEPRSRLDRFLDGCGDEAALGIDYFRTLADSEPGLWEAGAPRADGSVTLRPLGPGDRALEVPGRAFDGAPPAPGTRLLARAVRASHGALLGTATLALPAGLVLPARAPAGELVDDTVARWAAHLLNPPPPAGDDAAPHRDRRAGGAAGRASRPAPDPAPDRARVLERVRRLYAMAQETEASPHEAEIALRRCQSLMAKFGIGEADLETSEFGSAASPRRTVAMHVRYFGSAVAALHDVLFVTGGRDGVEFRGYELDVRVARLTLEYLESATERALAARRRGGGFPAGRSAAYDYRVSFAAEVYRRVDAMVAERERAERAASSTGTALTVRKREIVERECGAGLRTRSTTHRGTRDGRAAAAGRADGARVSLDPQVGGDAAAARLGRS